MVKPGKTKDMKANNRHTRRNSYRQLALALAVIAVVNILGSLAFYRLDLTSDKRYTLAPSTRKMLKELKGPVHFKVYLEGDFPAGLLYPG